MYIWLQSYEGFVNAKNNRKQRNLNIVFANISKTASPTSNSFLLIMSQIIHFFLHLKTGSIEALHTDKGHLDEVGYQELGRKRAPNFTADRGKIYKVYEAYEVRV